MDAEKWLLDERQRTSCPFALYLQLNPVPVPESLMREIEDELQNPTGIRTLPPPKNSINGLFLSKECGILYELTNTEGMRFVCFAFSFSPHNLACLSSHSFFRKVTTCKSSCPNVFASPLLNSISPDAGFTAIGYLIMLLLFSRQVESSRTPSGISRVSRWTFLAQTTMDSVSFAGHITFAILAEGRTSLSLIAPAFLSCVLFTCEAVRLFPLNYRGVDELHMIITAILCTDLPDTSSRKLYTCSRNTPSSTKHYDASLYSTSPFADVNA